jgi:DNA-binding MarR family transcriptional regulator
VHIAIQVLLTAQALEKKALDLFKPHGLTPAQFNVLHLLSDQPEAMRASDLAHALIVDPSNVTGLLKRMKQVGLLRELENTGDRRRHIVGMSAKGRAVWKRAHRDYEKNLAAIDSALSPASRKTAGKVLQKLQALF